MCAHRAARVALRNDAFFPAQVLGSSLAPETGVLLTTIPTKTFPLGARVLAVANAFDELVSGLNGTLVSKSARSRSCPSSTSRSSIRLWSARSSWSLSDHLEQDRRVDERERLSREGGPILLQLLPFARSQKT